MKTYQSSLLAVLVAAAAVPNLLLAAPVRAWADFSEAEIAADNMAVSTRSAGYNSSYGNTWVLPYRGTSRIAVRFSIYGPPTSAILMLRHLTSASSGSRGGGYAPIAVTVNGAGFLVSYDVAEHHDGSHGLETDEWDISDYVRQGENSITLTLEDAAETHYWIQRLEVAVTSTGSPSEPNRDACATGVVAGFVVCGVPSGSGDEAMLKEAMGFVVEEGIGELISQGAGYLAGLASKSAGLLAGHLTSFFLSFIQALPTANPPTRVRYAFLTADGADVTAYVSAGTPVHAVALVQPGTEILDIVFDLRRPDGTSCFKRSVGYDDLSGLWHFDRVLVLLSEQPIVLNTRGTYRLGNATLTVL